MVGRWINKYEHLQTFYLYPPTIPKAVVGIDEQCMAGREWCVHVTHSYIYKTKRRFLKNL